MEDNFDKNEKIHLKNYWNYQDIVIEDSIRMRIDNLLLLSRRKRILESNQFINARKQGIHLIMLSKDSTRIENWVKEFIIRYDNLTQKEFKNWLIKERNRLLERAKKAKKNSFYFDVLKTIKLILNGDQISLKNKNLKNKLLKLFKKDEIEDCFFAFEENKINSNELIQIQSQWSNIKKLKMTGQIAISPSLDENRIRNALLNLINEL